MNEKQQRLVYSDFHILLGSVTSPLDRLAGSSWLSGRSTLVHCPPWPHVKWALESVSLRRAAEVCCSGTYKKICGYKGGEAE